MERFRGSSELPLTAQGVLRARELAMQLAQKGGLDEIHTSNLGRTVHTSRILSQYTHAPIVESTDGLHPWHLGGLEGQEVNPESLALQKQLTSEEPDIPIAGRGPLSTADGESFNSFKARALAKLGELIAQHSANPNKKIAVVTHYRVKKLLDAWIRKGLNPEGEIDTDLMTSQDAGNDPGGIDRFSNDPDTGPQMSGVDLKSPASLQGGLYFLRHESTPWNHTEST